MLISSKIFSGVISSTFVPDVYDLIRRMLYIVFTNYNLTVLFQWYNSK